MPIFLGWRGSFRPRSCSVTPKEWYTHSYNRQGTWAYARRPWRRDAGKDTHRFPIDISPIVPLQPRSVELHHILGTVSDILEIGKPTPYFRVQDPLDNQKPPKIFPLMQVVEPQTHTPYVRNQSYLSVFY